MSDAPLTAVDLALGTAMQAIAIAVAAILESAPGVVAITGRSDDNVVRGRGDGVASTGPHGRPRLPVLAYQVVGGGLSTHADGPGEFDVQLDVTAIAADDASALALLAAAESALTLRAFGLAGVDATLMEFDADDLRGVPLVGGPAGTLASDRVAVDAHAVVWASLHAVPRPA